jgi:F-type H+-transporting ATPase subunit alpha
VPECRRYEKELYSFLDARHPSLLKAIAEKKDIKGELTDRMKAALVEFGTVFQGTAKAS